MRVQPDSRELFRPSAEIYLILEKISHRFVIELDANTGYFLLDRDEVFNKEQVIRFSNTETSDLIVGFIPEVK